MFLKSITLKNFRGVGHEEKRVEFAPVTLLFGPNNAGKSTIIKALHLAREIFCGENPDYDRIGEFGHGSSLGSFKDYVHNHDLNTEVSLGVEIGGLHGLEIRDLDAYPAGEEIWTPSSLTQPLKRAESAGLEIKIKWDFNKNKAVLGSYGIFINGERLTSIEFDEKDGKIYGEAELFNIKQWIKDDSLKAIEEAAAKADEAGDNREFYKKKLEEEIKKAIPEYFKPFADAGALFPPSPEGGSRYFSAGKREKRKTIVLSPDTLA
ncbi:MAG: AAA family ATPase, partial [Desulfovibrio sp.]|nr:AAA family ATPase [Desulfovibrio sp.]